MQNQNPLGIDFANIIAAAERRRINLETIGQLLAVNVSKDYEALSQVHQTYEMLELRWEALDPEGRGMLPPDVKGFLGHIPHARAALGSIMDSSHMGLGALRKYAVPILPTEPTVTDIAEPNGSDFHTGEYRIETAFASNSDETTIGEALSKVYATAEGGIGGTFEVRCDGSWCWVHFVRELSDDRQVILERIARNMLLSPAKAAIEQIEAEFLEYAADPDDQTLINKILEALGTAHVSFPGQ